MDHLTITPEFLGRHGHSLDRTDPRNPRKNTRVVLDSRLRSPFIVPHSTLVGEFVKDSDNPRGHHVRPKTEIQCPK